MSGEIGFPVLRGVPIGEPLPRHAGGALWGAWGEVGGRLVLATGDREGTVRLCDPIEGTLLGTPLTGHRGGVWWGAWGRLPGGEPVLATGGRDGTVRLWNPDLPGGRGSAGRLWDPPVAEFGDPMVGPGGAAGMWGAWSRQGRITGPLATGSYTGSVHLWDAVMHSALGEALIGHSDAVMWGAWGSVDGMVRLATGDRAGEVRLWNLAPGVASTGPLTVHDEGVLWGAWGSVDGQPVLATGDRSGQVRLSNPATGDAWTDPLTGHEHSVEWGAWGEVSGRPVLATGGHDGTVRLWNPVTGAPQGEALTGHNGALVWGAWGNVGGRPVLATGDDAAAVRLWDPATGTALGAPLTGHSGSVLWGAWGEVGHRPVLATGDDDGQVLLWEVVEDRPVARLPFYRSDVPAASDELARAAEAEAVAELITARTARPPLAVGLFGDWGEGKSHFLGMLQKKVEATAKPDNPLAHSAVRQVSFNAWHYAETDLWASLVAELFAQLAAPLDGDLGEEQRRQSRLTAELVTKRHVRERLQAAKARRDVLEQALKEPERLWDRLPAKQQDDLRRLAGDAPEKVYAEAARTVAALRETGRASWRLVRSFPLATAAVLVVLAGATLVLAWGLPTVWGSAAALPGIACAAVAVREAVRLVRASRARASEAWKKAVEYGEQQRRRLQTAADVAAAEVAELTRQVQNVTAAGQLAGLVADRAAAGDYRSQLGVMTRIREDFQRMAALLAGAADDDRDALVPGPDEAGDELPRIDRIILYIDDMDRCPPRRVVEMLEAVHLLLAVELFVVVVAVDPRWLMRAIGAHYRDLLEKGEAPPATESGKEESVDPDDEELWHSTPAQYLEKIFQVVLTLPPLDTGGFQRMLHTLVGVREDQPAQAPHPMPGPSPGPDAHGPDAASPPRPSPLREEAESLEIWAAEENRAREEGAVAGTAMFGVELPAARVIERVDPLTLEPDEITLLDLLGPPLLVATPRTVKRLANSYGLLTAIRRDHREADLDEHQAVVVDPDAHTSRSVAYRPYRAAMVLLAALVAYPSLGPALFLHLHHTAAARPGETWARFRASLSPRRKKDRWWSEADSNMTPVQAQRWQALLHGLDAVERSASEHGLPLPEPLSAWGPWVVPVGRLSFPTGRIVSSLERQRPLDPRRPDADSC
ncbi:P-loop NTPase fold protein [Streptomyces sp. NPDC002209]|uniref:P-loop NTPase fold protein n=1 Tax=Streptomyces sp. NPDC002209 TaxID=3364638 RepID=UPI0036C19AFB